MIILGAGMAGLLAGSLLRNKCTSILEAQPSLPNNHSAVLRFRSSIVGDAVGIPFKKVKMVKCVLPWKNQIADMMAYSQKTNGTSTMRSIVSADGMISERYIAPDDFIDQLAKGVMAPISLGLKINKHWFSERDSSPIISTLPMPMLMNLLDYEGVAPSEFPSKEGFVITADIEDCDSFCSLYLPNPMYLPYRISITRSKLIIEVIDPKGGIREDDLEYYHNTIVECCDLLGLKFDKISNKKIQRQKFAKILPIDENVRKRFILWASEKHDVYSLGRFSTWRPELLLDGLVNDVRQIQRMVESNHNYEAKI